MHLRLTIRLAALAVVSSVVGCSDASSSVGSDAPPAQDAAGPVPDSAAHDVAAALDVPLPDAGGADVAAQDLAEAPPDTSDALFPADVAVPECGPAQPLACDDGDPCTADTCADGVCAHAPMDGCCQAGDACDDGVACTLDSCNTITHVCKHTRDSSSCCVASSDCDDFSDCTADVCVNHTCRHVGVPGAACSCVAGLQCDDNNPCTADTCSGGACFYAPTSGPGCCQDAAACDDGDALTDDGCLLGTCWHAAKLACAADADCPTTNPCETATCSGGTCATATSAGCCLADFECVDGWPETTDRCVDGECLHYAIAAGCSSAVSCVAPSECASATCSSQGICSLAPTVGEGCCASDADCPADTACESYRCTLGVCTPSPTGAAMVVWSAHFDSGDLEGFTVAGGAGAVTWQLTTVEAWSPPAALYYGRLPQSDYDVGTTAGTAQSPPIALPVGALTLRFARNADIEPGQANDKLWLTVDVDGAAPVTLWDKTYANGPGLGWKEVALDLSPWAGQTVRLTFHFDSVDGKSNGPPYEGVYVDDVQVTRPCPEG